MKKIRPLNGRMLVVSRGTKDQTDELIALPKQFLRNSDVCTDEDGRVILKKLNSGVEMGETEYLIEAEELIAFLDGDSWKPLNGHVLLRKCLDPQDDSGIITPETRSTRFAEILAVSDGSALQNDLGGFAYVNWETEMPQKIEETQDDWIVHEQAIEFVMGE